MNKLLSNKLKIIKAKNMILKNEIIKILENYNFMEIKSEHFKLFKKEI